MADSQHQAGDHERLPGGALAGSILLFGGAALAVGVTVEKLFGLPFAMPRIWYTNAALCWLLGVGMMVAGGSLLRGGAPRPAWRPTVLGRRFRKLTFYTRAGCHLCDNARDVLRSHCAYLPDLEEVDVDAHPRLREQFGECVPVVEIDGKVRFRGRVEETLLRRLIEGTPPLEQDGSA